MSDNHSAPHIMYSDYVPVKKTEKRKAAVFAVLMAVAYNVLAPEFILSHPLLNCHHIISGGEPQASLIPNPASNICMYVSKCTRGCSVT